MFKLATSFSGEIDARTPSELLVRENGRIIFPYPYMAVIADTGKDSAYMTIPSHPPPEHGSMVLQATIGCPWSRCLFCRGRSVERFLPRPEDVKEDILLAKKYYGDKPTRIFLGEGNSIALRTDKLLEITRLCFDTFPKLERVSTYGSTRFIVRKGLAEIRSLSQAGLNKVYVGLESGDDEVLKFMDKGATSEEMIQAADILRDAEMELSATVLLGLGGAGRWKRSAEQTAKVLNQMKPTETRPHHLILHPNSPLYAMTQKGEFKEATRHEILKELRELVSLLDYDTKLHLHRLTLRGLPIEHKFPEEKEKILEILDFALYHFFGEPANPELAKKYSMTDLLKWDGYVEPPTIDFDDL